MTSKKILQQEYKRLHQNPVEGFTIGLVDDSDFFQWKVALFGPPDTLYEGGYFRAVMKFPKDYPYSPPTFRFITKMFHSNIYENGEVCISILHSPVNDEASGEQASERWNPTQTVRTILLSVISLLNEPNTSSPANVDASVMYRRWKEGNGNEYAKIIKKQVEESKKDAQVDGVEVPETVSEYCRCKIPASENSDVTGHQTSLRSSSRDNSNEQQRCQLNDLYDLYVTDDDDDDDDDDYYDGETDEEIYADYDEDDDSGAHDVAS